MSQNYKTKLRKIKEIHKIQGNDGNWNYDGYMLGYFNGIENCLSILEERDPKFRTIKEIKKDAKNPR